MADKKNGPRRALRGLHLTVSDGGTLTQSNLECAAAFPCGCPKALSHIEQPVQGRTTTAGPQPQGTVPTTNRISKTTNSKPRMPLGPYPHVRAWGHVGNAPRSNSTRMTSSIVPMEVSFV